MTFKQEKLGNSQNLIQAMANLDTFGDYIYYFSIGNKERLVNFSFHGPKWAEPPMAWDPKALGATS